MNVIRSRMDPVGTWPFDAKIDLIVLYGIALILRLGAVFFLGVPDPIKSSEDGMIAGRLVSGQGYTFDLYGYRAAAPLQSYMPPLYVLFVAFFLRFWNPIGLGIVQAGLSSVTPLLIYRFAEGAEGKEVGRLAAGLVAVYPVFVIQAARPFTLSLLSLLLISWLTLMSSQYVSKHSWIWIAVGILAGLASLIRASMFGLVLISLAGIGFRRKRLASPGRAVNYVIVGAVLVVAPWIARNTYVHRAPVFISTNGGFTFWNGNNPFTTGNAFDVYLEKVTEYLGEPVSVDGKSTGIAHLRPYPLPHMIVLVVEDLSEVELDRAFYHAGLSFVRAHPRAWFSLLAQKIVSFWWFRPHIGESRIDLGSGGMIYRRAWILPYKLLYAAVFPFFVVGFLVSLRSARFYMSIYLLLAYLTVVYALFNVTTRYRWEIEPLILFFVALALWQAFQATRKRADDKVMLHP